MTIQSKEIKDNPLFKQFCNIRNLSPSSAHVYKGALTAYANSQNTADLEALINEADNEEEQRIRYSQRKIKTRFIQFKTYLQDNRYENQTTNDYLSKVRTFYKAFDITTPELPRNKITVRETYKDLIKKEHIQEALRTTKSNKVKALILFMCSSGTAARETSNITIQDFIEATREYHNENSIEQVVKTLSNRDDIVPTFTIIRWKTKVPYFTFCTPEASRQIIIYLKERMLKQDIKPEDRLFDIKGDSIEKAFARVNDKCHFGRKSNTYRFFHTHGLRKFFGTTMFAAGVSEMTIDFLEGRSISRTRQAYYKPTPEELKQRYLVAMNHVTIFEEVTYNDINSKEREELLMHREKERERDNQLHRLELLLAEYKALQK